MIVITATHSSAFSRSSWTLLFDDNNIFLLVLLMIGVFLEFVVKQDVDSWFLRASLYHGIQSDHFLANRWGNNGNSDRLFFCTPKITANDDYNHEIKRHLVLGRKAMKNLDSILKSRDITLSSKVYLVQAMVFPVVMYGCESWTIKKAEHQRIDAFELWCWRKLFRVPWAARRSN